MQLPHIYDWAMWPLEYLLYARQRIRLFTPLSGAILELGSGTGANLHAYDCSANVTAIEIELTATQAAQERQAPQHVRLVVGDGQRLPFADGQFDYVTTALVFCSLPEPGAALDEIRRVLRPYGRLVQLEHTCTGHAAPDWILDHIAPAWKAMTGGCHINRDTAGLLQHRGWHIVRHERHAAGLVRVLEATPPP